jgi:hypothetical protein
VKQYLGFSDIYYTDDSGTLRDIFDMDDTNTAMYPINPDGSTEEDA